MTEVSKYFIKKKIAKKGPKTGHVSVNRDVKLDGLRKDNLKVAFIPTRFTPLDGPLI